MMNKPLFLTSKNIEKHYRVDSRQVADIVKDLHPCGVYGKDNLYSRRDVEKIIKKGK